MKEFTSTVTLTFEINNLSAFDKEEYIERLKEQYIELYDLLTKDQREQIADMMMEAMEDNYIFPEIWEMKVEAIIDSERATT